MSISCVYAPFLFTPHDNFKITRKDHLFYEWGEVSNDFLQILIIIAVFTDVQGMNATGHEAFADQTKLLVAP